MTKEHTPGYKKSLWYTGNQNSSQGNTPNKTQVFFFFPSSSSLIRTYEISPLSFKSPPSCPNPLLPATYSHRRSALLFRSVQERAQRFPGWQPSAQLAPRAALHSEYILTHENDNRCEKITASPPVASVMDLIISRQFELFWGLLQKKDFFSPVGDPCWETCSSIKVNSYRGQPSGSLHTPSCQEFPLAPFSDVLIIYLIDLMSLSLLYTFKLCTNWP